MRSAPVRQVTSHPEQPKFSDTNGVRSIAAIFMSPVGCDKRQQNAAVKVKCRASGTQVPRIRFAQDRKAMDTTTVLIIVIIVLLLGGGGFYGRGRWW